MVVVAEWTQVEAAGADDVTTRHDIHQMASPAAWEARLRERGLQASEYAEVLCAALMMRPQPLQACLRSFLDAREAGIAAIAAAESDRSNSSSRPLRLGIAELFLLLRALFACASMGVD